MSYGPKWQHDNRVDTLFSTLDMLFGEVNIYIWNKDVDNYNVLAYKTYALLKATVILLIIDIKPAFNSTGLVGIKIPHSAS